MFDDPRFDSWFDEERKNSIEYDDYELEDGVDDVEFDEMNDVDLM